MPKTAPKPFAERLGQIQRKLKQPMAETARRSSISRRTLEDWLHGKRTPPSYTQDSVLERLENLLKEKLAGKLGEN